MILTRNFKLPVWGQRWTSPHRAQGSSPCSESAFHAHGLPHIQSLPQIMQGIGDDESPCSSLSLSPPSLGYSPLSVDSVYPNFVAQDVSDHNAVVTAGTTGDENYHSSPYAIQSLLDHRLPLFDMDSFPNDPLDDLSSQYLGPDAGLSLGLEAFQSGNTQPSTSDLSQYLMPSSNCGSTPCDRYTPPNIVSAASPQSCFWLDGQSSDWMTEPSRSQDTDTSQYYGSPPTSQQASSTIYYSPMATTEPLPNPYVFTHQTSDPGSWPTELPVQSTDTTFWYLPAPFPDASSRRDVDFNPCAL